MKKIFNQATAYVDEMLAGLVAAHPEYYQLYGETGKVIARAQLANRVRLVLSRGGSGHLPIFTGYVGMGLLDACAIGDIFASPSAEQMADAKVCRPRCRVLRLWQLWWGCTEF